MNVKNLPHLEKECLQEFCGGKRQEQCSDSNLHVCGGQKYFLKIQF